MDTKRTERQQDREANAQNQKYAVHARAMEIMRNTPGIITMSEAIDRARAQMKVGR
jgi:hypothetical protein